PPPRRDRQLPPPVAKDTIMLRTRLLLMAAAAFLLVSTVWAAAPAGDASRPKIPPADQVLKTLKPDHPRILADAERFAELGRQVKTDALLGEWYADVRRDAERMLDQEPSKYEIPDGLRLLATSRRVLDRMLTLGMAYRLSGEQRFAERAWAELAAAAAFKDWNPRHFLDTAEMTAAFGIGYDWFFDAWTADQRSQLRRAIVEKGFTPGLKVYRGKEWWSQCRHNWNQVCNGGLGIGALAIGDEEPEVASEILHSGLVSLPLAMTEYGPDGAWAEGPGYWGYATKYNVFILAAMETALGTDFGLSEIPGFSLCGMMPIYSTGPSGRSFNYADSGDSATRAPEMWWLATRFHQPGYAWYARTYCVGGPLDMLWYDAKLDTSRPKDLPLDRYFRGSEVVMMMRSAWDDAEAVSVDFKAGDNKANHSHLDLGSFIVDALGVRWACDLGSDDYNMPGYFGGKRWTYYRLRAEGHNTLAIRRGEASDKPDQDPKAVAPIVKFQSKPERVFAIADLDDAYAGMARQARRGITLVDRKTVLVRDEVELAEPADVWWFMTAPTASTGHGRRRGSEGPTMSIELGKTPAEAVLTKDKARLWVRILAPAGAEFEIMDAKPLPISPNPAEQNPNSGIRKLAIHLAGATSVGLTVAMVPLKEGENPPARMPEVKPLAQW
ncbi:MAG: heparinase II/III domain-containing protein, partial [Thermoguttaceae bacterium]